MDLKLEVFKKMYLNFYKKNPFAAIKFPDEDQLYLECVR